MKIWVVVSALLGGLVVPGIPAPAEAPEFNGTYSELTYHSIGESGYSFRWTPSEKSARMNCELYEQCGFADILGPDCPGQVFIALEFYDESKVYLDSGGDVFDSRGKRRFMAMEIGTNRDITFDTFKMVDVFCGAGVPTGRSSL